MEKKKYLMIKEVCFIVGIHRATLHRWMSRPEKYPHVLTFPRPYRIGNHNKWLKDEVVEWKRITNYTPPNNKPRKDSVIFQK